MMSKLRPAGQMPNVLNGPHGIIPNLTNKKNTGYKKNNFFFVSFFYTINGIHILHIFILLLQIVKTRCCFSGTLFGFYSKSFLRPMAGFELARFVSRSTLVLLTTTF